MSEFVRPHYQNAPIAEALIDIRVANPDAVTLEQLTAVADALASEFPNRQPIQQMQMGFQADPDVRQANFFNAQTQIGWRLAAKDQSRVYKCSESASRIAICNPTPIGTHSVMKPVVTGPHSGMKWGSLQRFALQSV